MKFYDFLPFCILFKFNRRRKPIKYNKWKKKRFFFSVLLLFHLILKKHTEIPRFLYSRRYYNITSFYKKNYMYFRMYVIIYNVIMNLLSYIASILMLLYIIDIIVKDLDTVYYILCIDRLEWLLILKWSD